MKSFGNDEDSLSSNQLSFGYNDSENNTNYVIVNLFSDWRKCQNYASYLCPEKLYLSKWMSIVGGLFSSFWRLIIMTSIKLWISQSTTNQSGRKLLPHNQNGHWHDYVLIISIGFSNMTVLKRERGGKQYQQVVKETSDLWKSSKLTGRLMFPFNFFP